MNVFYVWILWTYHIQIQFQYLTYNQLPEMDRKKYLTHYQNRVQIFFLFQLFYLHMFGKIQKIKKNISYTYFQSDYDRFRWYFYSIYNFSNESFIWTLIARIILKLIDPISLDNFSFKFNVKLILYRNIVINLNNLRKNSIIS